MMRSMTGFGEAHAESNQNEFRVEIRAVNNRYLKCSIRLPEELAQFENEIERLIRQQLVRGSVNYRLSLRDMSPDAAAEINVAVLSRYCEQLASMVAKHDFVRVDAANLALLPGVMQPREMSDDQRQAAWRVVEQLTKTALHALREMRAVEGAALAADLEANLNLMSAAIDHVRDRAPLVVDEYRSRLHERIKRLLTESSVELAQDDLVREVAVYADRSDISEEIQRLRGHITQFRDAMRGQDAAGRKLDFIAQEMLREANTIGSKSGDAEITRRIVDIKSAIDRVKEQVQNVE